jgi:hypothetical protein
MDKDKSTDKYKRARQVERIADELVKKLGVTVQSRPFMCKVAYKLSEARIWENFEKAQKAKKSIVGLFIYLCKVDMGA